MYTQHIQLSRDDDQRADEKRVARFAKNKTLAIKHQGILLLLFFDSANSSEHDSSERNKCTK
jgi:hypothetical protein